VRARRRIGVGRRSAVLISVLATVAAVIAVPVTAVADPPPNPSDQQINSANQSKDQLATEVGQLSAQIAVMQSKLDRLNLVAERAEQKLALALERLQQAKDAAVKAQAQVKAAQAAITKAQADFVVFAREAYTSGQPQGLAGGLLTASDPNALLQRGDYLRYVANSQLAAIGGLSRATVAKSNADAAARKAVNDQTAATAAAAQAKRDADAAVVAAQAERAQLTQQLADSNAKLDAAKSKLAELNNQRTAYLAWKAEQERIARERALALARARAAAAAAAAARAAAIAAAAAQGGPAAAAAVTMNPGANIAIAASAGGGWSSAAANTAVARAMSTLGIPYAFAGGTFWGPSRGVPVDFDSRNDGNVIGYDCSGLTLFAWGPYLHMSHYAPNQWGVGSYHPSTDQLLPGDLVFWSEDGTVAGIGHVALYIGGGNVIQAPYSGSYIQVTPLWQVEAGYFGATRPLT
jgi:cell wall-associated NlpC family hydrolase